MGEEGVVRPLANYDPSIWGDSLFDETLAKGTKIQLKKEVEQLKKEVQKRLLGVFKDPKRMLVLVDDIQRLGVAYHFEEEIDDILHNFYKKHYDDSSYEDDLYYVSLRFRLLRQHGFYMSCDIFAKFYDENGKFKDDLKNDLQAILSLYEASYLRVHGENILDDGLAFATTHLTSLAVQLNSTLAEQISHALERPNQRRTTRLESKYSISIYESNTLRDETLLRFARQDFNLLQILHRKELKDVLRWWRSLDITTKLPFVRDRMVETFYWTLGVYYEPKYSFARITFTKLFKIITIIDDIYDTYGTIEELKLFTEAIQRWDKSCVSQLPDYMKFIYQATLDTIQDIEEELTKEGRSYGVYYVRQETTAICIAFMQEATWCHENHVPTYEEYMRNGNITAGEFYLNVAAYLGMGDMATKEAFEWIRLDSNKALVAANIIGRLTNDMAGHKIDESKGQVSAVQCYMAQFGVTLEEAYKEFHKKLEVAWKDINQAMLRPFAVPRPLLTRAVNLCRTRYDFYRIDKDGYTKGQYIQAEVEQILIKPVTL